MQLSDLKFERRTPYSTRAKVYLRGGHRLYLYRYNDVGDRPENNLTIYLNNGSNSGHPVMCWVNAEPLVAQCALHFAIGTHGLYRTPWQRLLDWWHS